jgi:hypothetical protein
MSKISSLPITSLKRRGVDSKALEAVTRRLEDRLKAVGERRKKTGDREKAPLLLAETSNG